MMRNKKIALLASILVATLVVGVYAVILSNTLTASWTVVESGANLELSWYADTPGGSLSRGVWYTTQIRLRNTGVATYTVIDKFDIYASGYSIPDGSIVIQYWDGDSWEPVGIYGWGTHLTGYFGPSTGFSCGPGYDATTLFRYMFEGNALLTEYSFSAWVEQV